MTAALIATVFLGLIFGFAWHNEPARKIERDRTRPGPIVKHPRSDVKCVIDSHQNTANPPKPDH